MSRRGARGVRVIAGTARGRRLVVPDGEHVRPTKDIVREAVFSALDARDRLVGATVLDLFAGSGALAIEALSRGAARAVLVERDRAALAAIEANVDALDLRDRVRVVASDAHRFLRAAPPSYAPFDLVYVDPPYATSNDDVGPSLGALESQGWLVRDALAVVEQPARGAFDAPGPWSCEWQRTFGDTLVAFYRREWLPEQLERRELA